MASREGNVYVERNRNLVVALLSVVAFLLCVVLVGAIAFVIAESHNDRDKAGARQGPSDATALDSSSSEVTTSPVATTEESSASLTTSSTRDTSTARSSSRKPSSSTSRSSDRPMTVDEKIASGVLIPYGDPGAGQQDREHARLYSMSESEMAQFPDEEWWTWDKVTPGMAIGVRGTEGQGSCTLGFIVYGGPAGNTPFAATAGHCTDFRESQFDWIPLGAGKKQPLGMLYEAQYWQEGTNIRADAPFTTDYAMGSFFSDTGAIFNPEIANTYRITGVVRPSEIRPGIEMCKFGYRTQETCGPVIASNGDHVRVALFSIPGDSGSPLYVKQGSNSVKAVGILSGSPLIDGQRVDSISDFALISPVLEHTGMRIG